MITWTASSLDSRVGAVLVLLSKAVALGAGVAGLLTLLNAIAFVFTTRGNPFPGIVLWAAVYLRLFNSATRLRNEGRAFERGDVVVLMAAVAPVALLSALPLNSFLLATSIQLAMSLSPDAAIRVLFE